MSSSLTRTVAQRALVLPRALVVPAQRTFTTSLANQKTATESVKDGLKKVDRVVSDNIAIPAVDAVAAARDIAKDGVDKISHSNPAAQAEELKGQAKGKANELGGRAKGAAKEAEGKAKGAAEEFKQKL
ncbi:unnamed protein product [Clonostachys rosea f. rosea IK726]|uniref:Uncharacterized protein n=1 Tax=Clonostachys rosea f. rosea IK726 TaxID=1349383 RepID=A0ACA9TKR5_BIOOC|nr:unnamed protein product [Clonostachys rosea f. rosea IK726]